MKAFVTTALVCAFSGLAMAQIAGMRIKVIEGEGAMHPAGAHVMHPLTVEVTDDTGRPVAGAAVSFQLPPEGPSGVFSNGLRTDLAITDANGRAALRSLQLNRTAGPLWIRITAAKEQARAGIVCVQHVGESAGAAPPPSAPAAASKTEPPASGPVAQSGEITRTTTKVGTGSHKKWIVLAIVAAGGAAAFAGVSRAAKSSGSTVSGSVVSIGSPVITIGHP